MENKSPLYILAIQPSDKLEIPRFFREDNPIVQTLQNPKYLRYMGWNTLTLDKAKIVSGDSWEVKNGDRKNFKIFSDGTLIGIVFANTDFLGWGKDEEEFIEHPNLKSLAVIEYTYEFFNMYQQMLINMPSIEELIVKASIINIKESPAKKLTIDTSLVGDIFSGANGEYDFLEEDFNADFTIKVIENKFKPEEISFDVIEKLYTAVSIPSNKIPYTTELDGKQIIDIDKIKSIR